MRFKNILKLNKIALLAIITMMGSACDDYLDVNTDPNTPADVSSSLILPAAMNSTATTIGGDMFNYAGFFVQYFEQAPEANQYNAIAEYNIKNEFFDRNYDELYAGALNDYHITIQKAYEEGETGNALAAIVMKAYTMQYIVDVLDRAPYSEAFLGSGNGMPAWDLGSDIYDALILEIDNAIDKYNEAPMNVANTDMVFGGLEKGTKNWIKMANSLKLKLMMRGGITEGLSALVSDNNFILEDVTFDNYADEANKQNPWYGTNISSSGLGTTNVIGCYPIVQTLLNISDPRLDILFEPNEDEEQFGNYPGYKSVSNSDGQLTKEFSKPIYGATKPVVLYSYAELNFFLAEYYATSNVNKASEYYQAAVTSNLIYHGIEESEINSYLLSNPFNGIESIGKQKWIALCMVNNMEAWCEARRLDYPEVSDYSVDDIVGGEIYSSFTLLVPKVNTLGNELIKRLPYPQTAKILNDNTPDQPGMKAKVWWDVK